MTKLSIYDLNYDGKPSIYDVYDLLPTKVGLKRGQKHQNYRLFRKTGFLQNPKTVPPTSVTFIKSGQSCKNEAF